MTEDEDTPEVGNYKPQVSSSIPARVRESGRFPKGLSGNPGGKLASVKAMIEEYGETIVANLIDIAIGSSSHTVVTKQGDAIEVGPSAKDQISASHLCMSYWLGNPDKPSGDSIDEQASGGIDTSKLSPDELRTLLELMLKAKG